MYRNKELEKQIDAYVKGQLNESEAQELWEELLKHPRYIELLNTELGVQSVLGQSHQSPPKAQNNRKSLIHTLQNSWQWVAAAAAVVVMVLAVNFFIADTNQTLQQLSVSHINLSENLVSAPVLRSAGRQELAPADSLLNLGFKAAVDGDLPRAMRFYDTIIKSYRDQPAAVQAYLNKGIIQFNEASYDSAALSFKAVTARAEEGSFTREKGYWFLGNTYINIDRPADAREAIYQAYRLDGIYREPAIDLLNKLDEKLGKPRQDYKL